MTNDQYFKFLEKSRKDAEDKLNALNVSTASANKRLFILICTGVILCMGACIWAWTMSV